MAGVLAEGEGERERGEKMRGIGETEEGTPEGLSTLCSQFSLLYANSLCSRNLTIMLKRFHYYAQNFFPGSLIFHLK